MKGKIISFATVILILTLSAFIYFKFYFVFGEGVKAGELNFVVYKGYVFKTYEGRAIQAGFGKGKGVNAGAIQSYEFDFSITKMQHGGLVCKYFDVDSRLCTPTQHPQALFLLLASYFSLRVYAFPQLTTTEFECGCL